MQFYGKPDKRNFGFNPWLAMPVYSSLTTKRQKSNIFALQDIERFPFDRNSEYFKTGTSGTEISSGKFPENLEIIEFP